MFKILSRNDRNKEDNIFTQTSLIQNLDKYLTSKFVMKLKIYSIINWIYLTIISSTLLSYVIPGIIIRTPILRSFMALGTSSSPTLIDELFWSIFLIYFVYIRLNFFRKGIELPLRHKIFHVIFWLIMLAFFVYLFLAHTFI
jgi:hypothetical protein